MAELTGYEKPGHVEGNIMALHDKIDGLDSDLSSAIEVMVEVAQGKRSVASMGCWVSLNYPRQRKKLPLAMRATPPKRSPAGMRGPKQ